MIVSRLPVSLRSRRFAGYKAARYGVSRCGSGGRRCARYGRYGSAGYSLIELLVAMAIALFLLAGLLTIVQTTRNTYTTQTALASLQDNERLAMILATDVIQAAGYFPDPTTNELDLALPAVAAFPAAGQSITGTSGDDTPGDTDTISVRFMTANDDTILNCAGGTNKTGADVTYINTFSVDADGNLDCTLSTNGAAAAPVPLVSGIKDLQIWYGVATKGIDANVDTYLTASQMTATDWSNVTSVKVRLTFTNPLAAQQPGRPTTNYIESVVGVMGRIGAST